jgi:hypothetical protein
MEVARSRVMARASVVLIFNLSKWSYSLVVGLKAEEKARENCVSFVVVVAARSLVPIMEIAILQF